MVLSLNGRGRLRAGFASAVACLVGLLAAAGVASAACPAQQPAHPFAPWSDPAPYVLAPDGGFEAGSTGWRLSGGAAVRAGNEPFHVAGAGDRHSLKLPAGSSAQTAPICIDIAHPTLRLFARNGGSPLSTLAVSVVYRGLLGLPLSLPVGVVTAGASWAPTLPVPVLVNLLTLTGGSDVTFGFTPVGSATWSIDDVYVDPYSKG